MKKLIQLWSEYTSFEGSLFRYSLAYSLLLALAPGLTVFVVLFVLAYLDPEIIVRYATQILPEEYIVPFVDFLLTKDTASFSTVVVSLGVSLWLASRSISSFLMISAKFEKVSYPKWMLRVKSVFLFLGLSLYLVISLVIVTSLKLLADFYLPFVTAIGLVIGFTGFYRSLSYRKNNSSYGFAGALFSSVAILLSGYLFFAILNRFMNYDTVYGPLASLMILLLSTYLLSNIIYFGYLINLVLEDEPAEIKESRFFKLCEQFQQFYMRWIKKIWNKGEKHEN